MLDGGGMLATAYAPASRETDDHCVIFCIFNFQLHFPWQQEIHTILLKNEAISEKLNDPTLSGRGRPAPHVVEEVHIVAII